MNNPLFPMPVVEPRPLRDYQIRAIGWCENFFDLVIGAQFFDSHWQRENPHCRRDHPWSAAGQRGAIFVVPRLSLIEQTVTAFEREGVNDIGVLQGRHFRTDPRAPIQIASAQTLARRDIAEVLLGNDAVPFIAADSQANIPGKPP